MISSKSMMILSSEDWGWFSSRSRWIFTDHSKTKSSHSHWIKSWKHQ